MSESILREALERMDRARNILTNGSPTPDCNWGMLDTSDLREAIAAIATVSSEAQTDIDPRFAKAHYENDLHMPVAAQPQETGQARELPLHPPLPPHDAPCPLEFVEWALTMSRIAARAAQAAPADANAVPVPPKQSVFLANLHYFFAQTDGTYKFPNGSEGDLLKQAKREIEAAQAQGEVLYHIAGKPAADGTAPAIPAYAAPAVPEGYSGDQIYAAWKAIGADVAGLDWAKFAIAIQSAAAQSAHAEKEPK